MLDQIREIRLIQYYVSNDGHPNAQDFTHGPMIEKGISCPLSP